jgi:hypothetical protein
MGWFLLLTAGLAAVWADDSPWSQAGVPLFRLTRNLNANEVIYEVRPQEADPSDFIHPYWRMFAKDKSGPVESLTFLETKFGYSADKVRVDGDTVRFSIRALPTYELAVKIDFGKAPEATVRLLEAECAIERVHLEVVDGIWPDVRSAEITCRGPARKVLLTPNGPGKFKETLK